MIPYPFVKLKVVFRARSVSSTESKFCASSTTAELALISTFNNHNRKKKLQKSASSVIDLKFFYSKNAFAEHFFSEIVRGCE